MAEETPSVRIIDRIADPAAEPDFSFDGDAPLLEMIFPQVLSGRHAAALRGEAILVDCASAKQASRVTDMLSQLGVDTWTPSSTRIPITIICKAWRTWPAP